MSGKLPCGYKHKMNTSNPRWDYKLVSLFRCVYSGFSYNCVILKKRNFIFLACKGTKKLTDTISKIYFLLSDGSCI